MKLEVGVVMFHLVHTVGLTLYSFLLVLLLATRTVPRTPSGAGFWSSAILFAIASRVCILLGGLVISTELSGNLYLVLNLFEKPILLVGVCQFFKLDCAKRRVIQLFSCVLGTLFIISILNLSPWYFKILCAMANFSFLFYIFILFFGKEKPYFTCAYRFISLAALILSIHWLVSYPIIYYFPNWGVYGFILGTMVNLVLYLALLASVLITFQRRLLKAEKHALKLAYHDALTGLKNKRYLTNFFNQANTFANRPHQLTAVFYIDLDNFKPINDSSGHKVGDEVLRCIATRLIASTRSTDICARIGGDEFIVIATQLDSKEQAEIIARKLLISITQEVEVEHQVYKVGGSIGISFFPTQGNCIESLIEKADKAMYAVKSSGKCGYKLSNP